MTIAAVNVEDCKQTIADTTHELLLEADGVPDPRRQACLDEVVLLNARSLYIMETFESFEIMWNTKVERIRKASDGETAPFEPG